MKIKTDMIFIAVLFQSFVACSQDRTEMTHEELQSLIYGPRGQYSTVWLGTLYQGTTGGFHYFIHKVAVGSDILIKTKMDELTVNDEMEFARDDVGWLDARNYVIEPTLVTEEP